MIYLTHLPAPPLSHFVEWFFFYDGYAPPHTKEKRLPDGAVERIINLREEPKVLFDGEKTETGTAFLLKRMGHPDFLRMGPELAETVDEILAKVDQMAKDYA